MTSRWALVVGVAVVVAVLGTVAIAGPAGDPEPVATLTAASPSPPDPVSTTAVPATAVAPPAAPATAVPATAVEPSAAPSTTAQPPGRTATLAFTGDIIPHGAVVRQAQANAGGSGYDFAPMFAQVAPILSGVDLALCHLETPLSADNTGIGGYPTFNAPRELATAIAGAGYDGCSTASNHSYDEGRSGVLETVDVLEAAGVGQVGMARSAVEAGTPKLYTANGITVGHLSFTYGLNGFELPSDGLWMVSRTNVEQIHAAATRAREAGAEYVVLSIHWGVEYQRQPSDDQLALLDQLLPHPDLDLIVGHHAHVVQPIDRRGDDVVVFGLGNFLSNQSPECCVRASQDGVIVKVTITEDVAEGLSATVEYVPTRVDRSDYTITPVAEALAAGAGNPETLQASLDRTVEAIGLLGAEEWGVTPAATEP